MIRLFLDKRHKEQASPQRRLQRECTCTAQGKGRKSTVQTENSNWPNMLDAAHEARDRSGLEGQGLRLQLGVQLLPFATQAQAPFSGVEIGVRTGI